MSGTHLHPVGTRYKFLLYNVKWSIDLYNFFLGIVFLLLIPMKLYTKHPKKMPLYDQKRFDIWNYNNRLMSIFVE
jgi:hypothetical protein